jgi:small multidrug resistance family-3 protein
VDALTIAAVRDVAAWMSLPATTSLFVLTACAEILGCYLPYLWVRRGASAWILAPGAVSLAIFAWLLTLHPMGAGRVYAAYGGVYVATAVMWLWVVDGQTPDRWDLIGAALSVAGMMVIVFGPRSAGAGR